MKNKLEKIRGDLEAALEMVGADNGVTFDIGSIGYTDDSFKVTLNAMLIAAGEEGCSHRELEFRKHAERFGLLPEHYGQTVSINGGACRVVGISPKSRKYPILMERGGAVYKYPRQAVKDALERARGAK